MVRDYIPRGDGELLEWAKTLTSHVGPKVADFNIPSSALTSVMGFLAAYQTAFDAAHEPNRGKVDVFNKNNAKKALLKSLRTFCMGYLIYNPLVTDADRETCGLPVHDTTRTPTPAPRTVPVLEIRMPLLRQIAVHFKDAGSVQRGKPAYVHAIDLRWALLPEQPLAVAELIGAESATASPYTFTFEEADRGKALYICSRWANSKENKGSWGEIVKAIVP
ncbi:hypothetical protein FACS1894200_13010 [Spirochaetia bacterium]|nr:hypothetical protein FACS1894200_13010 [Spirochaetia bacterium]